MSTGQTNTNIVAGSQRLGDGLPPYPSQKPAETKNCRIDALMDNTCIDFLKYEHTATHTFTFSMDNTKGGINFRSSPKSDFSATATRYASTQAAVQQCAAETQASCWEKQVPSLGDTHVEQLSGPCLGYAREGPANIISINYISLHVWQST